ncbi:MAG: hypothetical protein IAE97_11915 [Chthoniobacterales bacterium]|nr:hypothetical protein [Chthoniobacterales bacterium]
MNSCSPGRARLSIGSLTRLVLVASLVATSGCAIVRVRVHEPSAAAQRRETRTFSLHAGNEAASALLLRAQQPGTSVSGQLAALIEAARLTSGARPGDRNLAINRAATRRIVAIMASKDFASQPFGDGKSLLKIRPPSKTTLDPRTATRLVPAGDIRIRGLRVRTVQDGVGVPYVAWFASDSPALRGQAGIPPLGGFSEPVNAQVVFRGRQPELVFHRMLKTDSVQIGGRPVRLAADFSAPLAYMLSRGRNRDLDIRALMFTRSNMDNAGLYQFERFDPDKIPVVFVHGLMSRPETWTQTVNELLGDPAIRTRYQFWFYLYPTGLPVWSSAAKLRSELDRFRSELDPGTRNANLDRKVLVGHSMGGLICSLLIREGGKSLWQQFSDTPPDQLNLSPGAKQKIIETVEFRPRNDVSRVVFFATPHRGSDMALNPVSVFFSRLVRLPFTALEAERRTFAGAVREEFRDLFITPANSLVFLRARSPLLMSILNLPRKESVPTHSIIGDRGRGDTPDSSDGVVPYWSSHLPDAASEKIVPSAHGANEDPEGIAELRRILLLPAGRKN